MYISDSEKQSILYMWEHLQLYSHALIRSNWVLNQIYRSIEKNRVSHDYRGSVGSASLNIAIVKETYLSPLTSNRETERLSNTAIFKLALPTEPWQSWFTCFFFSIAWYKNVPFFYLTAQRTPNTISNLFLVATIVLKFTVQCWR
jgi:hypothetical protein